MTVFYGELAADDGGSDERLPLVLLHRLTFDRRDVVTVRAHRHDDDNSFVRKLRSRVPPRKVGTLKRRCSRYRPVSIGASATFRAALCIRHYDFRGRSLDANGPEKHWQCCVVRVERELRR